ncbi:hypothetical protein BDF14DRAFT_1845651 [Spinellus fusiger]|nr:hypothetical protein BDF14DRAFT_1845651 [Spinellus fusiger]
MGTGKEALPCHCQRPSLLMKGPTSSTLADCILLFSSLCVCVCVCVSFFFCFSYLFVDCLMFSFLFSLVPFFCII